MSEALITRRRLLGAGVVVVAGGAGAWSLFKPKAPPVPPEREALIASHREAPGRTFEPVYEGMRQTLLAAFPFLIIPRETMDDFLAALSSTKRKPRKPDQVKQLFLLSTDFFAQGADESLPLSFATLYDAYRSPCYNPMEPA